MFEFILGRDVKKIIEKAHELENSGEENKALSFLVKESKNKEDYSLYLELGRLQAKMDLGLEAHRTLSNAHMLASENITNTIERTEDGYYLGSRDPHVAIFLANLYIENENFDKASEYFKETKEDIIHKEIQLKTSHLKNFPKDTDQKKKRENLLISIAMLTIFIDKEKGIEKLEEVFSEFPETKGIIHKTFFWLARHDYQTSLPHIHFGKFLLEINKDNQALESFNKAIQINRDSSEKIIKILSSKESSLTEKTLDYLFNLYTTTNKQEKALELLKRADIAKEKASKYYRKILKSDKKNLEARKRFIDNLIQEKKYKEASEELDFFSDKEKYFNWALEKLELILQSPDERSLILASEINIKKNNFEKAIFYLCELFKLFPTSSESIEMYLLQILESDTNQIEALSLLVKIMISKNEYIKTKILLEYILFSGNIEWIDKAYKLSIILENNNPDYPEANLFLLLTSLFNNIEQAKTICDGIIENNPEILKELIIKISVIENLYVSTTKNSLIILDKILNQTEISELTLVAVIFTCINSEEPEKALKYLQKYELQFSDSKNISSKLLENITGNFPKNKEVLKTNIIISLRKNKLDFALENLKKLLDFPEEDRWTIELFKRLESVYPNNHLVQFRYLDFLLKRKLYSKLLIEIEKAINIVPEKDKSYLYLIRGKALLEKDDIEKGILSLSKCIELSSKFADQAVDSLERLKEIYNHPKLLYVLIQGYGKVENYLKASECLIELTKFKDINEEKIIDEFNSLLKKAPTNAYLRWHLGKVFSMKGEDEKSANQFQLAVSYDHSLAESAYEEVNEISKRSDSIDIVQVKGLLAEICGKYDEFYKSFEHIFSKNPNDKKIYRYVHQKYEEEKDKLIYKILESRYLFILKKYEPCIENILEIETSNKFELSVLEELFQEIIKKYQQNPKIWFKLGKIQIAMNDYENAVFSFQNSFELSPDSSPDILSVLKKAKNPDALILMSEININEGHFDKACEMLKDNIHIFSQEQLENLKDNISKIEIIPERINIQFILMEMLINLNDNDEILKRVNMIEKMDLGKHTREKMLTIALRSALKTKSAQTFKIINRLRDIQDYEKFSQQVKHFREKKLEDSLTKEVKDIPEIAKILREFGYPNEALSLLKNIRTINGEYEKALCLIELGKYNSANMCIRKYLKTFDLNIRTNFLKLYLILQLRTSDFRGALGTFQKVFSSLSNDEKNIYSTITANAFGSTPLKINRTIKSNRKLIKKETLTKIMESL